MTAPSTFVLIIDGTIRHAIVWDGTAEQVRAHAHRWLTRGDFTVLPLAAGSTVAIQWRAVRTLQVAEDPPVDEALPADLNVTLAGDWSRMPPGTR